MIVAVVCKKKNLSKIPWINRKGAKALSPPSPIMLLTGVSLTEPKFSIWLLAKYHYPEQNTTFWQGDWCVSQSDLDLGVVSKTFSVLSDDRSHISKEFHI